VNTATLTVTDTRPLVLGLSPTIPVTNADGSTSNLTRVITAITDRTHITLDSAVATAPGQTVAAGAVIGLQCATRLNPVPYPEWPDPGARDVSLHYTAGAPGVGGLSLRGGSQSAETLTDDATITAQDSADAATSGVRLLYQTPTLDRNIRISGTPRVNLGMAFSKPKANLTAVLLDYPTSGPATILTRGWLDPQNRYTPSASVPIKPGQFYDLRFDLQPKDSVVVAGHRIGVMILSSDNEATIRPAPGTRLTMDLQHSNLELPIVGGASAL